ncbi:hypothetical protein QN391_03530, partial [Pseudomonas sp. CCI1.2]|uniref:hypothetical protein n=1 Tax=Pseudomonas sp. CCI1.2 TaxID=3048614 RepID=UPI002B225F96
SWGGNRSAHVMGDISPDLKTFFRVSLGGFMISKHIQKCLEIASALARSYPASIGVDYGYVYKKGKRLKNLEFAFTYPIKYL